MKVLLISSEAVPFAKTGGLADVAGSLPHYLNEAGCETCLALPLYQTVRETLTNIRDMGVSSSFMIGNNEATVSLYSYFHKDIPVYFVRCDRYFEREGLYGTKDGDYPDNLDRFIAFSRGLLGLLSALKIRFDIIHCNDWQTGLIPSYLKSLFKEEKNISNASLLFTIHNMAYQGIFPLDLFPLTGLPDNFLAVNRFEFWGKINLLKGGIVFSDLITTVSNSYSREIQTKEFGCGLDGVIRGRKDRIYGILNGIDTDRWSPDNDSFIASNYSSSNLSGKKICKSDLQDQFKLQRNIGIPLVGITARLTEQKGLDILLDALDEIMTMDLCMVILGTGEKKYHESLLLFSEKYSGKLAVKLLYDEAMSHKIEAGADIFLMPSRFEPCGLNQIYSLRYGTVPLVHATGGLNDTITEYDPLTGKGNGFKFEEYTTTSLIRKIRYALNLYGDDKTWSMIMLNGMSEDFSWAKSSREYIRLYTTAMELKKKK